MESPASTGEPPRVWIVWRQDDNGNRYEVARFADRGEADELAATMEARGHKCCTGSRPQTDVENRFRATLRAVGGVPERRYLTTKATRLNALFGDRPVV